MKRTEYHKLVRDRIPEIITKDGKFAKTKILSKTEFLKSLQDKLIEEAKEAAYSKEEHPPLELADLYEVIDTIILAYGLNKEVILDIQKERHKNRGGFNNRIKLLWVEEPT